MTHYHSKILIIGSGPAGDTTAIYAARAMMEPILVAGIQPGGQLTITTEVENYPGFADAIQGPWLMEQMHAQAGNVGTKLINDHIVSADLGAQPFHATGDSGDTYSGDTLVIATGAQARWLGLESEEKYKGFGVSACATCDGFFYRDKHVLVIGGGNTAVEEALYLTHHAAKVTLVHRRDALRAEKILQNRLFANDKIDVIWDSVLHEVLGGGTPPGVTGACLRNIQSGEITQMPIDGIFVAIGHAPEVDLFRNQVDLKPNGYIWTAADSTATSIPGVFAAGDVADDVFRQAVTAAGLGCMAALEAEKYLSAGRLDEAAQ
jgi:thioredoxin reductase (NADPH)